MGLFSKIFGGSKSKSSNQAYGQVSDALGSTLGSTGVANDALMQQLGLGEGGGGFQSYLTNMGFANTQAQGLDDIDAGAAGAGLLRSGSTAKAYGDYTTNLRKGFFDDYLQRLYGQAQLGIGAGQAIAGAGGVSSQSGTPGIAGFAGNFIGGGAKGAG